MMLNEERQLALKEKRVFISCIVPVYNEEAVIGAFLTELYGCLCRMTDRFEIVVVDDGSHDGTFDKILSLQPHYFIKLIGLARNFGKENALTAGIENCVGDVVILLDADFQHPVEMLPAFLQYWAEGYNMVYGVRHSRDKESYIKRNFARLFYWIMKKITTMEIPSNAGDFRLLDRSVVEALKQFGERTRFMKGLYAFVGFKQIGVTYEVQDRLAGKSAWGFTQLAELALAGITAFSDIPLRVWGGIGIVISAIALIYAVYIVTVTLIFGTDLPGFPTLIVAIMFLGGIQLLSIGILGEYIARIFTEVKHRPKYLIEKKYGFEE